MCSVLIEIWECSRFAGWRSWTRNWMVPFIDLRCSCFVWSTNLKYEIFHLLNGHSWWLISPLHNSTTDTACRLSAPGWRHTGVFVFTVVPLLIMENVWSSYSVSLECWLEVEWMPDGPAWRTEFLFRLWGIRLSLSAEAKGTSCIGFVLSSQGFISIPATCG
jgi:hypothetical protein